MRIRTLALALALTLAAGAAHAQDTTLERVQNLINTGRLTEARNTLALWERTHGDPTSDASPADRARALYLTGVLSTDPEAAEDAFLNVVLSHPSSAVAPDALLRLGQGLYTVGEHERAIAYLSRLQSDYPPSTVRETGILWLTRAQLALGAAAQACGTARDNLAGTTNPNLRTLIEIERDRACDASGGEAIRIATPSAPAPATAVTTPADVSAQPSAAAPASADPPTAAPAPSAPPRATSSPISSLPDFGVAVDGEERAPERARPQSPNAALPRPAHPGDAPADGQPSRPTTSDNAGSAADNATAPPARAADASIGEFAVQTAAFGNRAAAERIAAELRTSGFDARIVTVPGSPLFRVRYGTFQTQRDAAAAALHVRDAGFATLVVNDVRLETRH
jgi:septal ring-binding cell division protein DamX